MCFLYSDKPGLIKMIPLHTKRIKSGKWLRKKTTFKLCIHSWSKEEKKKVTTSQIVEKQWYDCMAEHLQHLQERIIRAAAMSIYWKSSDDQRMLLFYSCTAQLSIWNAIWKTFTCSFSQLTHHQNPNQQIKASLKL